MGSSVWLDHLKAELQTPFTKPQVFNKLQLDRLLPFFRLGDGATGDPVLSLSPNMTWNDHFIELFDRCVARYHTGDKDFTRYYDSRDQGLLDKIGYRPREFFDFVEDFCDEGTPSPTTALLVASVRRDYFEVVMKGEVRDSALNHDNIPTFGDELDGIYYLPRILAKARAKLRGELDPDLMYGCGGDRKFLRDNGDLHPAVFLRQVWAAGEDDTKLLKWIRSAG